MADLQITVETVESQNFGDHGERLRKSHQVVPGETVEDLVRRVFPALRRTWGRHDPTDEIVIRVVIGADGEVTGQQQRDPSTEEPF